MIGIDIGGCSGNPETCIAVKQILEADEFYSTFGDIDPATDTVRETLGNFVTSCAKGTCLGQNLDKAEQMLRQIRDEQRDNPSL